MARVDLGHMEELQIRRDILLRRADAILVELSAAGPYCYKCGETKPEGGFFPLSCSLWGFSGVKCNDCERKEREEA